MDDLLKCFLFCHKTKRKNKKSFNFVREEDRILMKFCENFNYFFEDSKKKKEKLEYHIRIKKTKLIYNVLGINEYSKRKRFSVIMQSPTNENSILIVKSADYSIINRLLMDEKGKDLFERTVEDQRKQGRRVLVYCQKVS